jgi:hypothetical protein
MARRAQIRGQLAFDEKLVEDTALENALEERERRRAALNAVRAEYEQAHEAAKVEIEKLELPADKAVRVGRFRIARTAVAARQVSFDTKATTRVRITLLDASDEDLPALEGRGPAEPERAYQPPTKDDGNVVDLANAARRARDGQPPVVHP